MTNNINMDWLKTAPMTSNDLLPTLWQELANYCQELEAELTELQQQVKNHNIEINRLDARVSTLERA